MRIHGLAVALIAFLGVACSKSDDHDTEPPGDHDGVIVVPLETAPCRLAFANAAGTPGACTVDSCVANHRDVDLNPANGCELEVCPNGRVDADSDPANGCEREVSAEVCNGRDDDGDGEVDEGVTGLACSKGLGACRTFGTATCAAGALTCSATTPPAGTTEVCDAIDNDCDGETDEGTDEWVAITVDAASFQIYRYEASRPDANGTSRGRIETHACSVAGRYPWANVTYAEAKAACEAAGARLCTEAEWLGACHASAGNCNYSQAGSCVSYSPYACNDQNHDVDDGITGVQNAVVATGTLAQCYADWTGGKRIYDLSGNVAEWSLVAGAGTARRGGSYTTAPQGTTCNEVVRTADAERQAADIGFRCCKS